MSYHRLALRACFAALFATIAGCGDAPTGSTLSHLSPLGRAPLADISAAATTTIANQAASGLCLAVSGTGTGATASLQSCSGGATQNWNVQSSAGALKLSASGQCLDAFGGNSNPGDILGLWSCHGGSNQSFTLASTGELKIANGLCIGPQSDPTEAANLVLQPCNGSPAQKWTAGSMSAPPVTGAPPARFTGQLGNIGAGLCLTSNVSGAVSGLQSCATNAAQTWSVPGTGTAGPITLASSGQCLDAFGGGSNAGDVVGIYACHGGGNQTFTLTAAGELRVANGLCVGPRGGAILGAVLELQPCTGASTQKWGTTGTLVAAPAPIATTPLPTSRFTGQLANAATGLCLTSNVSGGVSGLQSCASSGAQMWSVPGAGSSGPLTLVSNGQCVDAYGGTSNPGDQVGIYTCHGGSNQTFTLTTAGELRVANGLCVGPRGGASAGATLELQSCTSTNGQKWSASSVTAPAQTPAPAPAPVPAPTGGSIATEPALPTELAVPSDIAATGRTWRPMDGAQLREAIHEAQYGDQILLSPGVSYVGAVFLSPKSGSGWITIKTDLPAGEMPAPGVRVTPASAARLAKIVAFGRNDPAISATNGSRGWRIAAVEITAHDSLTWITNLIMLGNNTAQSTADVPSDFIFDRVYVHGKPWLEVRQCIALNSARTAIVNSSIEECHSRQYDTSALGSWAGPGPFRIENNSISGSGMGLFFGGSDPRIQNLSPSDIVIRGNRIWRPANWRGVWTVKNLIEFKHARRVLMEGNVIENNWADAQVGFAVVIKSTNQENSAPWSQTTDVTFRRNILRNSVAGISIAARPEQYAAVPVARVKIEGNVLYNIGAYNGTSNGRMLQVTGALTDVQLVGNTFLHNTAAPQALVVAPESDGTLASRLVVNNNIWTHGEYGWFGNWIGTRALEYIAGSSYQSTGNVLIGAGSYASRYTNASFAASIADIGFTNPSGGDFSLSFSSPFRSAGAGGSMPGADMSALFSATSAALAMQ